LRRRNEVWRTRAKLTTIKRQWEADKALFQNIPIRLATIGDDPSLAELIEAVGQTDRWQLAGCYDVQPAPVSQLPKLAHTPPHTVPGPDSWEDLLSQGSADIVALSRNPSEPAAAARRAEQLKRVVQAGVPLILLHPPCEMLLAYELDMHRSESRAPIYPYCPVAEHPLIVAVCESVRSDSSSIGQLEQIVWERFASGDQRQRSAVLDHLARDVLVLRRLLRDVSAVSATGAQVDQPQWGNLSVHFTGPAEVVARWSIGPLRDSEGARLTLIGASQSVSVWVPSVGHDIRLSLPLAGLPDAAESVRPAEEFLQRLTRTDSAENDWPGVSWDEVRRSLEVTDAAERSLQRRRTIELYHEQVTEHETFKSVMAAGGCAILAWVLLCLMTAGIIEGLQLPIPAAALRRLWAVLLVAPLAFFLALQLLQLVVPRRVRGTK
jgi:hypothetical protein